MFFPYSFLYRVELLFFDLFSLLIISYAHLVVLFLVKFSVIQCTLLLKTLLVDFIVGFFYFLLKCVPLRF
jgi:hypothetical protein